MHEAGPEAPPDLAAIYRAHAGFVWRSLRRFGVPDEALEDVVHDVFMIARRRMPDFDHRAAVTTWLYGIARGAAANARRSRSREQQRRVLAPVGSAPMDPQAAIERAQALLWVGEFLADLDPNQRQVFELIDIEGLRGPEVADLLGANLNVVYSRLRLARRRFETYLDARRAGQGEST